MNRNRFWSLLVVASVTLALGACASKEKSAADKKIDYGTAVTGKGLEVPPDLTAITPNERMIIPGGAPARGGTAGAPGGTSVVSSAAVLPVVQNARIERDGNQRWLVVKGTPEALWPRVRDFFLQNGMILVVENAQTGVMETDWVENYANVGAGYQRMMAKYLGSILSSGTRDKWRARMERGQEPGATEIYLSFRGMKQVPKTGTTGETQGFIWQPRPPEPEIEAEMLRLLLVHLGVEPGKAGQIVAGAGAGPADRATLTRNAEGLPVLNINEPFDRAWQRLGVSLDRIGFTVEDRDRSAGTYYVRYVGENVGAKKPGFFARMFGATDENRPQQYQIKLAAAGAASQATVLDAKGVPEKSKTGEQILTLLHEQLR
jgi:outer membrane protein assembly factor BamC